MSLPRTTTPTDTVLHALALALLALAFVTGGSSMDRGWGDVATQLLALPVLCLAVAVLLRPPVPRAHWVLMAIAALGPAVVGLQLAMGTTVTPWASERALYAWLPPVAAFLAGLALPPRAQRNGLRLIVALVTASLLLAYLQLAAPQDSVFNPFPDLVPMFNGLFANPNHQGTALAIGAVLLLSGAVEDPEARCHASEGRRKAFKIGRIGLAVLLLMGIPFTGSRGMVLIAAAALMALPLANGWLASQWRRPGGRPRVLGIGVAGVAAAALVAAVTLGWMRVDRLEGGARSTLAASTTEMAIDAMPMGAGAGSFVPWFDAHIPDALLQYVYYNHAHDEYVQWWLEGGIAGLVWIVLLLFGFVWARPRRGHDGQRPAGAWVGSWLGVGILLAHSVVDYPMRTPALATAGAWMAAVILTAVLKLRGGGSHV